MKVLVTLCVMAMAWLSIPLARADVGGEVPSPGICDYPFIGHSDMIGIGPAANVYDYVCDGPMEINGSHWHAVLYGESVQLAVQAGISMMVFNANVQATGNLGAIHGWNGYVCPDGSLADWPNPVGSWKNWIDRSVKCKPVGPPPLLPLAPDVDPRIPLAPPGVATVTNPENPNPVAIENPPK